MVEHYLETIAKNMGNPKKSIDRDAIEKLQQHNWTGNIRELRNVVERLIILSDMNITLKDVETYVLPSGQ
ncbi:MAG: hypothetical protein WDM71_08490 [Ferruginibacter sp.]